MRCGSIGVEMGTTFRERAGDATTGAKAGLDGTLKDGATRRVGTVVAGTGVTVRVVLVDRMVAPLGWPTRILLVVGN